MSSAPAPELKKPSESKPFIRQTCPEINAALLTGGIDRPYAFGLAHALLSKNIALDVIGSDELEGPEMYSHRRLRFLNLRGNRRERVSLPAKIARVLTYYARLIRYAATAKPKVFHILWNNKFQFFDRTLLMLYYKAMGRKIVFTAHNVNAAARDGIDSISNRLTLRAQYHLADHIFVHTEKMKSELLKEFGVPPEAVSVIPFGINNAVPETALTRTEARRRLGIGEQEKTILFFGSVRPYKGVEYLISAFERVSNANPGYRLMIAGEPSRESQAYTDEIRRMLDREGNRGSVISQLAFIPDSETELYFKAADVVALPYTQIYQSGVLFLAYRFGVPVIATDIGSFSEDIVEGKTGFLCKPCDPDDLAKTIEKYFASGLYKHLDERSDEIREHASGSNSWDVVAEMTCRVYANVLKGGAF